MSSRSGEAGCELLYSVYLLLPSSPTSTRTGTSLQNSFHFAFGGAVEYCYEHVCLSVYPLACNISAATRLNFTRCLRGAVRGRGSIDMFLATLRSDVNFGGPIYTRSPAITEGPRDAPCQLKSCQLPRNSAESTCMTSREPSISCR